MKIRRKCPFSKPVVYNEMEIDVTVEQLVAWDNGALIQDAMPHISNEEREFIMTGITPQKWEEKFGGEDE